MNPKIQVWLNTGMLAVIVVGLVYVGTQVEDVDRRLETIESTADEASARRRRPAPVRAAEARRQPVQPAVVEGAAAGEGVEAVAVDEHLWSGGGRAALDDGVAERMRERWQRTMSHITDRAIDDVSVELDLDEATTEDLRTLLSIYMEERSERWRALRSDGDVDPVTLQEEGERAREAFKQDVEILIGVEGLSMLQESLSRGRGL
ncbi:MAG TPA: hypothetical protein ENK18_13000 [Deltaproteobacteria bacterium]|nr:hypothetical protein [Deltaproteobacteria bacterium]